MRLQEIIHIIKENVIVGMSGVIILGVFLWIGYFVIYKILLKGKKTLSRKKYLIGGIFTCYIFMVLGITFLDRHASFTSFYNFHLLSSYIEAWNNFSIRHWQFLIFNIIMFVPLGFLLPLLHKRFSQWKWTIAAGLFFTLCIECAQFVTHFGVFDLDDIFNNLLGTWIGFGFIKGLMSLVQGQEKRVRKALVYFSPLFMVIALFAGIFTSYHLQEFGNLAIAPSYRMNMNDVKITLNVELREEKKMVPIYQAPTFNKDSAKEFAQWFFDKKKMDWSEVEITDFGDRVIYQIGEYYLGVTYLDGAYDFSKFSLENESVQENEVEESRVLHGLKQFGISIPEGAALNKMVDGSFGWIVDNHLIGDYLIDGDLYCRVDQKGTIIEIHNRMIKYNKVKNVPIKSEMEAYKELLEGNFYMFTKEKFQRIEIQGITQDYFLDSKGFYQPVYVFDSKIDGNESQIVIPAI